MFMTHQCRYVHFSFMDASQQLLRVERRQCADALLPLQHMSGTARSNFIADLGLPHDATAADIVEHLVDAVLSAPRTDRPVIIDNLLSSVSPVSSELDVLSPPSYATVAASETKDASLASSRPHLAVDSVRMVGSQADIAETTIGGFFAPEIAALDACSVTDVLPSRNPLFDGSPSRPRPQTRAPPKAPLSTRFRKACPSTSVFTVLGVLCVFALPVALHGAITGLAWDHTRYHTQLFAGLTGVFFFWPAIVVMHCLIARFKLNSAPKIILLVVVTLFAFAVVVPLSILFGEGIQGVFYYSKISVTNNVSLCDIPLNGGTAAYRVTDGAFVRSSYHVYTQTSTSVDDNGNSVVSVVAEGYAVRLNASCNNGFNIWAVATNNADPPTTYNEIFDNGVFQHSLVRRDCARDDNCPVTGATVDQVDTGPVLLMRNKDPSDRFQAYYDKMMTIVPASAVFMGLLCVCSVVFAIVV